MTPRTVDAPLVEPSAATGLLEVFRRRYLLRLIVRRELSARYQGSVLGFFWSYVNPLSQLFVYWLVLGKIVGLERNAENFAVHVFTGLIVVHFFTETFGAGTRSIRQNKAVVQKMALPREMFPVASMLVSAVHVLPQMVILVGVCLLYDWTPDALGMLAALLAMLTVMAFGTALALVFSVANVFFRDFQQVVGILTNLVRFSVPMIYPYTLVHERFPGRWTDVYLLNPLAEAVLLFQRGFWVGTTSDLETNLEVHFPDHLLVRGGLALVASLVMLALAQWIFARLENKIPERVS